MFPDRLITKTSRFTMFSTAVQISGIPYNNPSSIAILPYAGSVFNRINRVLAKHNIISVCLPHKNISNFLQLVQNNLGFRTPGVYRSTARSPLAGEAVLWPPD
jgi:hypothetical protein